MRKKIACHVLLLYHVLMLVLKMFFFTIGLPGLVVWLFIAGAVLGDRISIVRPAFLAFAFPLAYFLSHGVISGWNVSWPLEIFGWLGWAALLTGIIDFVTEWVDKESTFALLLFVIVSGMCLASVFLAVPSMEWDWLSALLFGLLWVLCFLSKRWFEFNVLRFFGAGFFLCLAFSFWGLVIALLLVGSLQIAELAGVIVTLFLVAGILTHRFSNILVRGFGIYFISVIGLTIFCLSYAVGNVSIISLLFLLVPILMLPLFSNLKFLSKGQRQMAWLGFVGSVVFAVVWQLVIVEGWV